MTYQNLTDNERQAMAALRANVEYNINQEWGAVYLDNACPPEWRGYQWSGVLGSLAKKGLYRDEQDRENKGVWGQVRLI